LFIGIFLYVCIFSFDATVLVNKDVYMTPLGEWTDYQTSENWVNAISSKSMQCFFIKLYFLYHRNQSNFIFLRNDSLRCGSENLELSTCLTAAAWHWIWTL